MIINSINCVVKPSMSVCVGLTTKAQIISCWRSLWPILLKPLIYFFKENKVCAWDLFGPRSDRYSFNHIESRVTRRNTGKFVYFSQGDSFPSRATFTLKIANFFITLQLLSWNKYLLQTCVPNPCWMHNFYSSQKIRQVPPFPFLWTSW